MNCRISGKPLTEFMDFGPMPLGNGFLAEKDFADEYFYSMRLGFCPESCMVQLIEQPDPKRMFHAEYAFFTGTSRAMEQHFAAFAEEVRTSYLTGNDPFVVEIGSNDGTFLKDLAARGLRHLGVEPSANVARAAEARGVRSMVEFFSLATARTILAQHGPADAIVAANVMCHIPDLHGVLDGAAALLRKGGVFTFEDPYLGDVLEKTSYDQFYDEHVFMFSALSIQRAAHMHGMELVNLRRLPTHGGSMRYTIARKGERSVSPAVTEHIAREMRQGLGSLETFHAFRASCERSRDQLRSLLDRLSAEKRRVAGYAATSKSTTIIQYCGLTREHIAFISDTTPIKQGKFSPGAHIPVVPYSHFQANPPEFAVLFAWNHAEEIMAKEVEYTQRGGKWVRFVPEVSVL
jgi:methylation protein EvaC